MITVKEIVNIPWIYLYVELVGEQDRLCLFKYLSNYVLSE